MKILLINKRAPFEGHGAEFLAWKTAKTLAKNGHRITIFCPYPTSTKEIPDHPGIEFKFVQTGNHNTWSQIKFFIFGPHKYPNVYNTVDPDIVIDTPSPFPFHIAHIYGNSPIVNKVMAIYRGSSLKCKENLLVKLGTIAGEESYRLYNNEDFITISKSTTERLENLVNSDRNNIYTNPVGIDASEFTYNIPDNSKQVLSLSKLSPRKSISTLVRAWKMVEKRHPDANLVIAGDGPRKHSLQELSQKLELSSVEFVGYVSGDVKTQLYSQSLLYTLPTLLEGFGLSNLEAMASGCAVISTDTWGVKDYIEDNKNGKMVAPRSPEELANAIDHLLSNRDIVKNLAKSGRETAVKFSLEDSLTREVEILEKYDSSRK
jgi:glycosyltransferase involved in cell wall biosynthesis